MRWDNLRLDSADSASGDGGQGQLPMFARDAVVRTFDTPGFRGMTFYEVHAKSIVSHVPSPRACRSAGRSTRTGDASILVFIVPREIHES
jgi:hypothetical protein